MGFNQDDFIKAFSAALSDTTIIKELMSAICDDLVKEVSSLREKVKKGMPKLLDWKPKLVS